MRRAVIDEAIRFAPRSGQCLLRDGPSRRRARKDVVRSQARSVRKRRGDRHAIAARIRNGIGLRAVAERKGAHADGIRARRARRESERLVADDALDRKGPALRRAVIREAIVEAPRSRHRRLRDGPRAGLQSADRSGVGRILRQARDQDVSGAEIDVRAVDRRGIRILTFIIRVLRIAGEQLIGGIVENIDAVLIIHHVDGLIRQAVIRISERGDLAVIRARIHIRRGDGASLIAVIRHRQAASVARDKIVKGRRPAALRRSVIRKARRIRPADLHGERLDLIGVTRTRQRAGHRITSRGAFLVLLLEVDVIETVVLRVVARDVLVIRTIGRKRIAVDLRPRLAAVRAAIDFDVHLRRSRRAGEGDVEAVPRSQGAAVIDQFAEHGGVGREADRRAIHIEGAEERRARRKSIDGAGRGDIGEIDLRMSVRSEGGAAELIAGSKRIADDARVARRAVEGVVRNRRIRARADREVRPILTCVVHARRGDAVVMIVIAFRAFTGTEAEEVLIIQGQAFAVDHVRDGGNDREIRRSIYEGQVTAEGIGAARRDHARHFLFVRPRERENPLRNGPRSRGARQAVVRRRARAVRKRRGDRYAIAARIRAREGTSGGAVAEGEGSASVACRGEADGLTADKARDRERPAMRRAVIGEAIRLAPRSGQCLLRDGERRFVIRDVIIARIVARHTRRNRDGARIHDGIARERDRGHMSRIDLIIRIVLRASREGIAERPSLAVISGIKGDARAARHIRRRSIIRRAPSHRDVFLADIRGEIGAARIRGVSFHRVVRIGEAIRDGLARTDMLIREGTRKAEIIARANARHRKVGDSRAVIDFVLRRDIARRDRLLRDRKRNGTFAFRIGVGSPFIVRRNARRGEEFMHVHRIHTDVLRAEMRVSAICASVSGKAVFAGHVGRIVDFVSISGLIDTRRTRRITED